MTKYFFRALAVVAVTGVLNSSAVAQQDAEKPRTAGSDEIVIIKKGDKDTKITVEVKGGEVTVNGKPLSEFNDDNVSVSRRRVAQGNRIFVAPRSPFRGGTNFDEGGDAFSFAITNKAMLGVTTEKTDKGVKVNSVSKGSAAEKGGLKDGDIITKVGDTDINTPEELTKAIGKFKPEDKTTVTYKRDNKEQKATVSLGKREGATTLFGGDGNDVFRNFNYDFNSPRVEGYGIARAGSPRLGIKAQDTEEGKGVKVLDVDEESNAAKAGVKEGDVITEFDGKAVNSATELAEAARDAKDKNAMKLKVTRSGKSQDLEIKIPKKLKTANL